MTLATTERNLVETFSQTFVTVAMGALVPENMSEIFLFAKLWVYSRR